MAEQVGRYKRPAPWRYIVDDDNGTVTILDGEDRYVGYMHQLPLQGQADAKTIVDAVNAALANAPSGDKTINSDRAGGER